MLRLRLVLVTFLVLGCLQCSASSGSCHCGSVTYRKMLQQECGQNSVVGYGCVAPMALIAALRGAGAQGRARPVLYESLGGGASLAPSLEALRGGFRFLRGGNGKEETRTSHKSEMKNPDWSQSWLCGLDPIAMGALDSLQMFSFNAWLDQVCYHTHACFNKRAKNQTMITAHGLEFVHKSSAD